jgi:chemotaxis signal transduction protein
MSHVSGHADIAKALGDPTRLAVLDALADGERSVGELVARLGASQPKVSNHLAALRAAGLVRSRRDRRMVLNALADERVAAVVFALRGLSQPAVQKAADGAAPDEHPPVEVDGPASAATALPRELVVFVLGGGEYALPIAHVREIVRYSAPRPLPGTAPGVLGIVQVQGRLLEAIDVRGRLGLSGEAPSAELVVVEADGRSVAMPVEAVRELVTVPPEQLFPPPVASAELDVVAAVGDRLLLVLRAAAVAAA